MGIKEKQKSKKTPNKKEKIKEKKKKKKKEEKIQKIKRKRNTRFLARWLEQVRGRALIPTRRSALHGEESRFAGKTDCAVKGDPKPKGEGGRDDPLAGISTRGRMGTVRNGKRAPG